MQAILLLLTLSIVLAQGQAAPVRVLLATDAGDIEIEVDTVRAPITAGNFLHYVDARLFDEGVFHRTVRPDNQQEKPVKIAVIQARANRARQSEFPPAIQ